MPKTRGKPQQPRSANPKAAKAAKPTADRIEPRKTGRPTAYRPEHCDRVIECGRLGMGRAEIAAEIDIDRETLGNWEGAHPEFSRAMSRAHDLALAWWETQGRSGIWAGKRFNAQAYSLQMRNRFASEYGKPDATFDINLTEVRGAVASKLDRIAAAAGAKRVAGQPQRG